MLKSLTRAAAGLALLFAPLAHAQTAPARHADPALWVVRDHDTTIYLFGTVHVLKPGLDWFGGAIKKAFDKSGQVMLEIVEPDAATMQGLLVKLALAPAGAPTISSQLPAAELPAYRKTMAELGTSAETYDRFKPWMPAVLISVGLLPKYGYDPESGAEKIIAAAAKAAGKPIGGLETPAQQLGYFDSLPRDRQLVFLEQTIDQVPEMGTTLDQMVARAKGDVRTLGVAMNKDVSGMPDMERILLTERNQRWAQWIAERLKKPGIVFVAVGAGHLAGPHSVQTFLKKRHLTAVRVKN